MRSKPVFSKVCMQECSCYSYAIDSKLNLYIQTSFKFNWVLYMYFGYAGSSVQEIREWSDALQKEVSDLQKGVTVFTQINGAGSHGAGYR